jgi:hypothetical protein
MSVPYLARRASDLYHTPHRTTRRTTSGYRNHAPHEITLGTTGRPQHERSHHTQHNGQAAQRAPARRRRKRRALRVKSEQSAKKRQDDHILWLPNGLAFSCRERAGQYLQNAYDLAREAVNCNAVFGAPVEFVRVPMASANHTRIVPRPSQPAFGRNHAHLDSRSAQRAAI